MAHALLSRLYLGYIRSVRLRHETPFSHVAHALLSRLYLGYISAISRQADEEMAHLAWDYRVYRSHNRAKSLYAHFEYPFRNFRVALLLHKVTYIGLCSLRKYE